MPSDTEALIATSEPSSSVATVEPAALGTARPPRSHSRKFLRAAPTEAEQARRVAWAQVWSKLNRDAIRQAMEANR